MLHRILRFFWLALCIMLAACQADVGRNLASQTALAPTPSRFEITDTPSPTQTASSTILPILTETAFVSSIPATETLIPSATPTETPVPSATPTELPLTMGMPPMLQTAPVFFYIQNSSIMMQVGDQTPVKVGEASDLGEIIGAYLADQAVYLARDQVIQRIDLSNGKSNVLLDFSLPITRAVFDPSPDHTRIFYAMDIADSRGDVNTTSRAGFIDLVSEAGRPFLSGPIVTEPLGILPLGLSADAGEFYCLPLGGDPSLTILWVIDTRNGSLKKELPFNGYGAAALSPDKRYVVTTQLWIKDKSGMDTENMIRLYDFKTGNTIYNDYLIPPKPNSVGYFLWSPDSQKVYFQPHDINTGQPLGVWRFDIPSGSVNRVANFSNPDLYLVSISPDGKWMVLSRYQNDVKGEIRLMDLSSIKVYSYSLPVNAWFAGWK